VGHGENGGVAATIARSSLLDPVGGESSPSIEGPATLEGRKHERHYSSRSLKQVCEVAWGIPLILGMKASTLQLPNNVSQVYAKSTTIPDIAPANASKKKRQRFRSRLQ
jgi:hypothetical protein